jgi:hypothetical protein
MEKLKEMLITLQDALVPELDSYEQAIYHYLFRHTYLEGKTQSFYSTRRAEIGFGTGDKSKKPSMNTRSKKLRSLEAKGFIKIVERSNKGILVELILPDEILSDQKAIEDVKSVDIETIDFFTDRKYLTNLLQREDYRCFYTGRKITPENSYLDHVVPQSKGGNNSYRNIVATCFDANSMKNDLSVEEFIRILYKEDIISLNELHELKVKIHDLQSGKLIPKID